MAVDSLTFTVVTVIYLATLVGLGYLGYRKTKGADDFMLAGRKVHPALIALSYGATFISTAAIIGFGGQAAKLGLGLMWLVFMNIALGIFMTAIDSYIFVPALPTIVRDMNTSLDWVSWTMTIFMLFMTAIMPLAGKLSDIYGRKKVYMAGIAIFTLGSLASSLSWDIYSLIAFRGIQAIGAGLVFPAAIAALNSAAPEDKKGKTMGLMMAMAAVSVVLALGMIAFSRHYAIKPATASPADS
jgi:hypothetical protein